MIKNGDVISLRRYEIRCLLRPDTAMSDIKENLTQELQAKLRAVPIHRRDGRRYFIRIGDIPNPWQSQFIEALRGSACPVLDGEGALAFAWDWEAWREGRWPGRSVPTGLINSDPRLESSRKVMEDQDILQQRRLARLQKASVDARLLELHRVAEAALNSDDGAVLAQALKQIDKWESRNLCNPHFVQTWRGILRLPPIERAAAMLREDDQGISLRQNSPFGFLLNTPPMHLK